MDTYNAALQLAKMGFYVFPIAANKKVPIFKDYTGQATRDPEKIKEWFFDPILKIPVGDNIGIATSKYAAGTALVVVDLDVKKGAISSIKELEKENGQLPVTLTQKTPSGGLHYIYYHDEPIYQGQESVLGPGVDVRSRGGYILGAGSSINDVLYGFSSEHGRDVAPAPKWLVEKLRSIEAEKDKARKEKTKKTDKKISQRAATPRAKEYLLNSAPVAIEGQGGDKTTFLVACKLKDIGVNEKNALKLMLDNWNDNCQPPWLPDELQEKITHAYTYGQNSPGIDSPEAEFDPVEDDSELVDPIQTLNRNYSFIVLGGKSTIIYKNGRKIEYMGVTSFHDKLKSVSIITGNGRKKPLSEEWFNSPKRQDYEAVGLYPEIECPPEVFNLWRGYNVKPLGLAEKPTAEMVEGVEMFKHHALNNVCLGNNDLYKWLMGYFAHLVQRPFEKPLVALVFKGRKGTGKSALIERLGNLFGREHFIVASNKRFLISNFNKHLEAALLFVLEEAFWSGDKDAEGVLKDLITGSTTLIEQKGREMYQTKNLIRTVIIGNEDWIVPTSEDERRYAVFNVGEGNRRDKSFFHKMRVLLDDKGGSRLLLRELMQFDITSIDINEAPVTEGLLEQKIASLNAIHAWWYSSLTEGTLLGMDFTDSWPNSIGRDQLRAAFSVYAKERGVKSWLPNASAFGRELTKCCSSVETKRLRDKEQRQRVYMLPSLEIARAEFDAFLECKIDWPQEEPESNVIKLDSMLR